MTPAPRRHRVRRRPRREAPPRSAAARPASGGGRPAAQGPRAAHPQRSRAMATAPPRTTRCRKDRGTPVDDQRHLPRSPRRAGRRAGRPRRHGSQPVVVPREHVPMPDQAPVDTRRGHGVGAVDDARAPGSRRSGVGLDPRRREAQERLTEQAQDDDDAVQARHATSACRSLSSTRAWMPETTGLSPPTAPGSRSRASRT